MTNDLNRRVLIVLGVGAVLGLGYACEESRTPTKPSALAVGGAGRAALSTVSGLARLTPEARQRIDAAKARMAWVGDIHHQAMTDWLAHLPSLEQRSGRNQRICAAAAALTLKYVPLIEQRIGVSRTEGQRRQIVNEVFGGIGRCKAHATMSIFGLGNLAGISLVSALSEDDTSGTEAVIEPMNSLVAAVVNSDGSVAAVEAITTASLENNSNLGTVDLQILAAVASLANSSAADWNSYSASGGFGADSLWYGEWDWNAPGGGGPVCQPGSLDCSQNEMSIFMTVSWWRKALFVVGSDAIGCVTAAYATLPTGVGAAYACAVWGLGTSAVGLLGVLLL